MSNLFVLRPRTWKATPSQKATVGGYLEDEFLGGTPLSGAMEKTWKGGYLPLTPTSPCRVLGGFKGSRTSNLFMAPIWH